MSDTKVAVITGGSRGIGRAVVERLAADGYRVFFCSRSRAAVEAADSIPNARGFQVDMGDLDAVFDWAETIAAETNHVDALVSNAAPLSLISALDPDSDQAFDDLIRVRMIGALALTNGLLELMQPGSAVVYVSGVIAKRVNPGNTGLSVTNSGIVALARAMAAPLMKRGVRIASVCTAHCRTDAHDHLARDAGMSPEAFDEACLQIQPLGVIEPAELAAHIVRMLDPEQSRHLTGWPLMVDGGALNCL